jgi:hypothetical protein
LLAPAPVFSGPDAVTLADGALGPAFQALKHDFGFRCGIPLPARHEFRSPFKHAASYGAFFRSQVSTKDWWM